MEKLLNSQNLEYFSLLKNSWTKGKIIGISGEKNFILQSPYLSSSEIISLSHIRKIIHKSTTFFENSKIEFEKEKNFFIEVSIKEEKGKFLILIDNNNTNNTYITHIKNLRYIQSQNITNLINENFISIFFDIPNELNDFVNSDKFVTILKSINVDENSNEFFYSFYDNKLKVFCTKEKEEILKLIISTAIEKESKLRDVSNDKNNTLKILNDLQQKNKTFYVNQKLIGMIIGSQGSNIKNLKKKYNVNIIVESKIVNDQNECKITVTGENGRNVEKCSKEINLVEKIFKIKKDYELKKNSQKIINDYNLKLFYINNKEVSDDFGNIYSPPSVTIRGSKDDVEQVYNNEIIYYMYNNNGYNNYNNNSYNRNNYKNYYNYNNNKNYYY